MDYKYCLVDNNSSTVHLIFNEFTKEEFFNRLDFDYYLKLEYVDHVIGEHIKFIKEFLSMFDKNYSEVEIVDFFNENFDPPYEGFGVKLVILDYDMIGILIDKK